MQVESRLQLPHGSCDGQPPPQHENEQKNGWSPHAGIELHASMPSQVAMQELVPHATPPSRQAASPRHSAMQLALREQSTPPV